MNLNNVIAERSTKTIYRDGEYAIKLFNEGYSAADVLNEALNLAIVEETGFQVPKLHEVLKIDGKWAIVTDFVEGKTLQEVMGENPADMGNCLERFVDVQIAMHNLTSERLPHLTDKMHAKISKSGLEATVRYELHTRLNSFPRHRKLCHGDYTPGNVIITPNDEVYVIDWAHATQGSASGDAARTYLRFSLAGKNEEAAIYLDAFCKKGDKAKQYVQKWFSIVAASQLVKGVPKERELLLSWANVFEYQ